MDTRLDEYKKPVSDSWKLKRFREIVQSDAYRSLNPNARARALYVELFIRSDNHMICNSTRSAISDAEAGSIDLAYIATNKLICTVTCPYDPLLNGVRLLGYGGDNDGR